MVDIRTGGHYFTLSNFTLRYFQDITPKVQ